MPAFRSAPLTALLVLLALSGTALARVRLGEPLPAHPWADAPREVLVVYSHDCGDLGPLWSAIERAGLPVRAVNAEDVPAPAPAGLPVWRGADATTFARTLKVRAYPTVLLVQSGRILNAWEGTFTASSLPAPDTR
nr:hypothetical protein [Deinococcus maricopensis]